MAAEPVLFEPTGRKSRAVLVGACLALCAGAATVAYSSASSSSASVKPASPTAASVPAAALQARAAATTAKASAAKIAQTTTTGKKIVYGSLSADEIRELFETYKSEQSRVYSTDDEETYRFGIFKKNLVFIDKLNGNNPLALFGVTRAADRTEEERALRRMPHEGTSNHTTGVATKYSDLKAMFASMDPEMAAAAELGPDATAALTTARNAAKRTARRTQAFGDDQGAAPSVTTDDDSSETWETGVDFKTGETTKYTQDQGDVGWVTVEECAACNLYPHFSEYNLGSMPDNFDWRELGAVTDVKNQAYCGSCWSFSTAADLEGSTYLATGNLTSLSNQQLVACSTQNFGCGGGYPFAAMQYAEHAGGLVTWDDLPYANICMENACGGTEVYDGTPTCDTSLINGVIEAGNAAALGGWQMVAMGASYEETMRIALAKNGPLSIVLNANGMDYYVHGITGCSSSMDCDAGSIDHHVPCDPESLDHAVLMVGYGVQSGSAYDLELAPLAGKASADDDDDSTDDDATSTDIPYWVIKNSWGSDWGEDGYYRIIRGENHCGIANFVVHSVKNKIGTASSDDDSDDSKK